MTPKLIIEQKITLLVNQYRIFTMTKTGQKDKLVAFAQQKRFNLKEKILFYADEQKTTPIFSFRAEKVFDVHGRFFIEDQDGKLIGAFRKEFKKSLINSTWNILEGEEPVITISESNPAFAIFRRVVSFIPFVDDFAELLLPFIRYHFAFTDSSTGEEIGRYRKTTRVRDHYELSFADDAYDKRDWRVFAAVAVALDALQAR